MRLARAVLVVATLLCAWLTAARLRLSSDLSTLFPQSGDAGVLARFTRVFGGRDPAIVLVRGSVPADVAATASAVAASLRRAPSVLRVIDRAPSLAAPRDPTLAWAFAGAEARARLAAAVTPEGMKARLQGSRSMLLAPAGDPELERWLARDPLRLAQIPWSSQKELAAGVVAAPGGGGAFATADGRARLVVAEPRGSAFSSADARALVEDFHRASAAAAHPGVTVELSGGHAIAWATQQMLERDLEVSGTLSLVLASLAFVLTFGRVRALAAVLPPLLLGTLWTTGIAALFPAGLSAVAVAFAAVVVGVGVDTGVHVYAALLEARRAGHRGADAARKAREVTWRPTLTAAVVAGLAFASLGLGGLRAMRQLGILCGAGEALTAVAILLVTPEIGVWLERGDPPPPPSRWRGWMDAVVWLTGTRRRALVSLGACALPLGLVAVVGWPRPAGALVAIRPRALAPLVTQQHIYSTFGGRAGQWVVLTVDQDEERARARADRVAEALEGAVRAGDAEGYDALSTWAPAMETQRARLAARDALDLPSRRGALASALSEAGFDLDACSAALGAFSHPSEELVEASAAAAGPFGWLLARHLAHDGADTLVATYVRPTGEPAADGRLRKAILAADPGSKVTGFDAIDRALRSALARDLWLVGGAALGLVALAMRLALRSGQHALVALASLACELGVVGIAMRVLAVRWHVYDALVVPVLFGVTVDESMFLLYAAHGRTIEQALRAQGPLVAATALTTAAGFGALVACRFDGLKDLGTVGCIGVLAGLGAALVLVPAALRILGPRPPTARDQSL